MSGQTRRRFLQGVAGATAASVAGCLGSSAPLADAGPARAQASFFAISDFASNVAGDTMRVENLVPFGQHGHGWEPGPDIQRRILSSDAFVYVGDGFQPWADNIVQNIHEDGADVAIIEAWADVDLLDISEDGDEGHDGHEAGDGDDHDHQHEDDHSHDDHEDETTHDHGSVDPHFWLDPQRAATSVQTITRGLRAVDPENESTLEANAGAFVDRLVELDETFHSRLSGRSTDTVLFAGHNSFRYLGQRYGFEIESLTGLSPDDTPSPQDVKRAQAIIDEHDIEYVLAPVFESDGAAAQLVEETDAVGVLPLTPVPSLTPEWDDDGWGFVDVMEHVNLDSLAKALGAV